MNSKPMFFVILAACLPAALATASYYHSGPAPTAVTRTPAAAVVSHPTPAQTKPPAPQATKLGGLIKELSKFDAYDENDQEELEGVQEPIVSYLSDFDVDENSECEDDEQACDSKDS